jgi:hypothetical protein
MAVRQVRRRLLPKQRRRDEDNDTLTRVGGVIVWVGVPLVAWGALIWAAIQAARSML